MLYTSFPISSYFLESFVKNKFLSKRSLKAGERIIKKQKEKFGLFYEELAEYKTPLERAEYNIKKYISLYKQRRKQQAMAWIKARRKLRKLPKDLRFLAYQNYKNYGKYTPERLADFITKAIRTPDDLFFDIWIYNADKRKKDIKQILKTSLKIRMFYRFMQKELREKFNKNYLEVSYFKGTIILTGFPSRNTPTLNKEQEEKLIKSFNCFFENFDDKTINKRKAVKIIYN